ncbi:MAG TPA: hypothetical protein DCK79_08120 [Candidatus Atribacteria bacterium]|nr:hypothetical protein [Candidatus Atribacteria bacterium]
MTYNTIVYKILIASPSDLIHERKAIPEAINFWNSLNSEQFKVSLLPVMWETQSTPEMGSRPQEIINRQLVDTCDILIGAFWTRIGTYTGEAESGTVEEIEKFIDAGKPVMLYFSSIPVVPESIDQEQYKRLKNFKAKCMKNGLVKDYSSITELREKIITHLTFKIRELTGEKNISNKEMSKDYLSQASLKSFIEDKILKSEIEWNTEKDSEPINIEEAKIILGKFVDELIDIRIQLEKKAEKHILTKFDMIISKIKELQRHRLTMDGGKSFKSFWDIGDEYFTELKQILNEIKIEEKSSRSKILDENKNNILKVLAKAEEKGIEDVTDKKIAEYLKLSIVEINYHLEELEKKEYIGVGYFMGRPPNYHLRPKGRKYLIENSFVN